MEGHSATSNGVAQLADVAGLGGTWRGAAASCRMGCLDQVTLCRQVGISPVVHQYSFCPPRLLTACPHAGRGSGRWGGRGNFMDAGPNMPIAPFQLPLPPQQDDGMDEIGACRPRLGQCRCAWSL